MIKDKNIVLLNVSYNKPTKANNRQEYFEVIYKDDDNTVKKVYEPPEGDIWFVKPEKRNYKYNKPEERIESMYKVRTPISKIRSAIAKEMGESGAKFIEQCYQERDFRKLNELYKWPYSYGADFLPEFYYLRDFYTKYKLKTPKLSVAFLDIETDLIDYRLDVDNIPNTAFSPVNAATVIFEETKESWTFVLKPYEPSKSGLSDNEYKERVRLYEEQKKSYESYLNNKDEFIRDLNKRFDGTYGHINYHIKEFEKEIDLIASIFAVINLRKPNFCLCWNMRFDIQYLYYRIIALGYKPESIMCHKDFENPKCYFKVDRSTYQLEKQYDYFYCSSYTQYICQMRLYASIRKSQHKLKRVNLNSIADIELKDKQVEYQEEGNLTLFSYLKWIMFIIYNIKDVLLQLGIERKCHDVLTYYMKSHANWTPYSKIFKETHLLRNVREQYFEKEGWVQGNNLNVKTEDDDSKLFYGKSLYEEEDDDETSFKGAINADPIWNAKIGIRIMGMRSNNIFANSMDYDMGAFYPSIKIASNMDPITLLYKASFDNDEFISGEKRNKSLNTQYEEKDKYGNIRKLDFTGEAVNSFASKNILTFCYNYLNLPSITTLVKIVDKELSSN